MMMNKLVNEQKLIRRLALLWAIWLITVVVLRVTEPSVLKDVNGATATIVTAVIGILGTVIAFYNWTRHKEGSNGKPIN